MCRALAVSVVALEAICLPGSSSRQFIAASALPRPRLLCLYISASPRPLHLPVVEETELSHGMMAVFVSII